MPEKHLLWKDPKELGTHRESLSSAKKRLRKSIHAALGMPNCEGPEVDTWGPPSRTAANHTNVVNEWRVPRLVLLQCAALYG